MRVLFIVSLHSAEKQEPALPNAYYTRQLSLNIIKADKNKMLPFPFQSILCFIFWGAGI